jgi:polyhydroxybutyrate depolymerase
MRVIRIILASLAVLVVVAVGLFAWFVYPSRSTVPALSGVLTHASIQSGSLRRSYLLYVPKGLPKGAPLLMVMHGTGQDGADARAWTGYGFDRLADRHAFAVVYPDGYQGYWDACNIVGDYSADQLAIDDVAFLSGLADQLVGELDSDPRRVFAAGVSRGGQMAFRLALEAPARFRAVAAVSANVPVPENFKCKPASQGSSSVMIMDGTADPLSPFEGGEVKFFGMLKRGDVLSAPGSGRYFADLDHLGGGAPEESQRDVGDGTRIHTSLWGQGGGTEVEFVAIQGGGHGMPQPYWHNPRILGPTSQLDGPAMIWDFFARQRSK